MDERSIRILEFNLIKKKLAAFTASVPGRELAEELFPSGEFNAVASALKETNDGVQVLLRFGNPPLEGLSDIRDAAGRLKAGGLLSNGELLAVAGMFGACRNLKKHAVVKDEAEAADNAVIQLLHRLQPNKTIEDRIKDIIISEDEISDNASTLLASLRRQIRDKLDSVKTTLNNFINSTKYKKYIQDSIITMRGDRFVIPVKQEFRNEIKGIVHDMSSSGATIFIEPMTVIDINNDIKQLRIKEALEMERILYEICSELSGIIEVIQSNIVILTRLDFIFAKAKLGLDLKGCCPKLNRETYVNIKKGRHPLIDRNLAVPIDLWIGRDFRILVVTGPNTGGKTVTLKTAGLFALMTQSGLFIPADDGTEMPVFDNIFADIGDEQSIEQSLSTFSSHMNNIVRIMKDLTTKSLVLLDELGAGTDPTEGAALAMSILERIRYDGVICIATTHYSELKIFAISTQSVENACCEFDVETLRPTFRLLIGLPGKSNAFAISQRLGLGPELIERAKEFLSQDEVRFEDLLMNVEKNRQITETDRLQAQKEKTEAEKFRKELENQKNDMDSRKDAIFRQAREEARKIIYEAKDEVRDIIGNLRKLENGEDQKIRNRKSEELRLKLKTRMDEIDGKLTDFIDDGTDAQRVKMVKPGDTVKIFHLGQKGVVVTGPDKDNKVLIQVGVMRISADLSELRYSDEQAKVTGKILSGFSKDIKARSVPIELNLIGNTVDSAVQELDKYIDSANMAGLHEVAVIHGKGTGALRSGIHSYLKKHPCVESYRLGRSGEGDAGVTIIQLKK